MRREGVESPTRGAPASRVVRFGHRLLIKARAHRLLIEARAHRLLIELRARHLGIGVPSRRVVGLTLVALALTTFGASFAHAHLGHVVVRAERYLKLDFEPTQVRFVVSLTLGPDETVRVQSAADLDRDGSLTQAEADAYMAEWGRGLVSELPFEVDGESVTLTWSEPWMAPIGVIERVPSTVEMVARVPLEPGRHTLSFRDGMRVETFDRTDVNVTTSDSTVRVVAAGEGVEPRDLVDRFAYGPQNAPEVVTVIAELPGTPPTLRWLAIAGGVSFVLAAIGAWIAVARRRARAPG